MTILKRAALSSLGLLALSFCLIVSNTPAFAEDEIIVNLKAQNLKYDEASGTILATGSVEARLKDVTVLADVLRVNVAGKVVTAEGNVSLKTADYSATGASLLYDASSEVGVMSKFYTVFAPKEINGKLYVRVEEFYEEPTFKWGKESDTTTCDYSEPHYDVKAKRFEYYPDDKLVGYSVTFYINRIPVMWFPVWVYSFKNRRASLMPVIGNNEVEGNFAKFGFDYFINNDANGLIFLDLMQKKGLGKGFEHYYRTDQNNSGTFYLYHLEERDTGLTDVVTRVDHEAQLGDNTKLDLLGKYADIYLVPFGRLDQTYGKVSLDHSSDRKWGLNIDALDDRWGGLESYNLSAAHSYQLYNTTLVAGFSKGKDVPSWDRFNTRLTHDQPLFKDNITFSTVVNFSRNAAGEKEAADELLQPQVQVLDREDDYSLRVFQNWYIDTDRGLFPGDKNNEYMEKQPEVTLSLKPRDVNLGDWNLFSLSPNFGAGRYHETKWISVTSHLRNFTTERYNANLTATKAVPLGWGSRLSLMGAVEQYLYTPGDQRYVLKDGLGVGTDLWGFFSNSINYQKGLSEGNTPFFFDIIGVNYENMGDTMTMYYLDKIRWVNSCGFNYKTRLYDDYLTRLRVAPDERLEGNVSTGYDINNKLYRDLVLGIRLAPVPKISWSWDSVHDINNNIFKSANSILDAEIGDDWRYKFHVRVGHSYDFFTGRFIMRDLMIVKDLHCWEMKYVYSDWLKEWRLSFTLKAFPEVPVGWGAGDRGYFFEGFSTDSFMQNFNQQSPSRF